MKLQTALVFASTLALAIAAPSAMAAIDVTPATTVISTDGGAAITGVGQTMLGLAAIAIVFKWAKAAIFG